MFFKNIATYSKKKMLALTIICNLIYVALLVVGPSIVIGCRYAIFSTVSAKYRITGIGAILFVVVGIYAYLYLKKLIRKLPEIKLSQQRVKFTLEMIFSVFPLIILIIGIVIARDEAGRAIDTLFMCIGFFIGALVFDGLFLKYIDAENDLRKKALLNKEIAKRENFV